MKKPTTFRLSGEAVETTRFGLNTARPAGGTDQHSAWGAAHGPLQMENILEVYPTPPTDTEPDSLSVLMAVYTRENPLFLRQSLESIFSQTRLPQEIVIVKDGPLIEALDTELTAAVERSPVPIRFVSLPDNLGLGEALRIGVEACQGDYVARMDTDDVALPNRFAVQMAFLEKNPTVDLLGAWIEEFNAEPGDLRRFRRVPTEEGRIRRFARHRSPFNHMSVIFRRSSVLAVGNYQPFYQLEDYYLWYRFLRAGYAVANLPEPLVYARIGNGMLKRRRGWTYLRSEWELLSLMRREGFLNVIDFGFTAGARFMARMLPVVILEKVYSWLRLLGKRS